MSETKLLHDQPEWKAVLENKLDYLNTVLSNNKSSNAKFKAWVKGYSISTTPPPPPVEGLYFRYAFKESIGTLLHYCTMKKNREAVGLLLQNKADQSIQFDSKDLGLHGKTPLELATVMNWKEGVSLFMQAPATFHNRRNSLAFPVYSKNPQINPQLSQSPKKFPKTPNKNNFPKHSAQLPQQVVRSPKFSSHIPKNPSSVNPSPTVQSPSYVGKFNGDYRPLMAAEDMTKNILPNGGTYDSAPLPSTHPIIRKVIESLKTASSSLKVVSAEAIHNSNLYRLFLGRIELSEARSKEPEFKTSLKKETKFSIRTKIIDNLSKADYALEHPCSHIFTIARLFHGTDSEIGRKVCATGFASLASVDPGWYGQGIYFTENPSYALKYTVGKTNPCLIVSNVILFNPFPVIFDDASTADPSGFRFYAKNHFSNFYTHVVPVEGEGLDKRPPNNYAINTQQTEFVVFEESCISPCALIHLGREDISISKNPRISSMPESNCNAEQVSSWIKTIGLSEDYSKLIIDHAIDGTVLYTMTNEDWIKIGICKFGDLRKLSLNGACVN